jgi:hypothetical protein
MASLVNRHGIQVRPIAPIAPTDDEIERARGLIIVRLRRKKLPWRTIGKILGISHTAARKKYHAIPERLRGRYANIPWFDGTADPEGDE